MIRLLLCLSFFAMPSVLRAWDPDDETFDPTISETVIDGASRIGDPSPFYREGYDERGFTYVSFTKQEGGNSAVNLAFILQPRADDPAKLLGGSLYISAETGALLAEALMKGADLNQPHSINKGGWMGDWTLTYEEEKGVVFKQEKDGQSVRFFLSVPAAKKLAGALNHSIQSLGTAE